MTPSLLCPLCRRPLQWSSVGCGYTGPVVRGEDGTMALVGADGEVVESVPAAVAAPSHGTAVHWPLSEYPDGTPSDPGATWYVLGYTTDGTALLARQDGDDVRAGYCDRVAGLVAVPQPEASALCTRAEGAEQEVATLRVLLQEALSLMPLDGTRKRADWILRAGDALRAALSPTPDRS